MATNRSVACRRNSFPVSMGVAHRRCVVSLCLNAFWMNRNLHGLLAGQLASEEWWGRQGTFVPTMPPASVLQDVLQDLFQAPALPSSFGRSFPSPEKRKSQIPWSFP